MKPALKKGILKHKSPEVKKPEPNQQIKWDEEVIAEQDKERGGKMKIREPKTPYNHGYNSVLIGFCENIQDENEDEETKKNGNVGTYHK